MNNHNNPFNLKAPAHDNPKEPSKWPARMAVLLSLVYPGIGQIAQRRWFAASVHFIAFTVTLVWFYHNVVMPLFQNLRTVLNWGMEGNMNEQLVTMTPCQIVSPFLVALFIYIMGIADTLYENRRRARAPRNNR